MIEVDATFFLVMLGVSIFGPPVALALGWWLRATKETR